MQERSQHCPLFDWQVMSESAAAVTPQPVGAADKDTIKNMDTRGQRTLSLSETASEWMCE